MSVPFTEETYAEEPALEWVRGLGWGYAHGPEIAPNGVASERASWDEVVRTHSARVYRLALQSKHAEYALMNSPQRLARHEPFQRFDAQREFASG